MLRRVQRSAVAAPLTAAARSYNVFVIKSTERRPQLTPEQRANVKINYDEWPAEFKDFDPEDPYKNSPSWIEGMTTLKWYLWGFEVAFIWNFYECVFIPKGLGK
jgi:hypothetical protein